MWTDRTVKKAADWWARRGTGCVALAVLLAVALHAVAPAALPRLTDGGPAVPGDPGVCPVPTVEPCVSAPAPARSRAQSSDASSAALPGAAVPFGRPVPPDLLSVRRPAHNRSLLILKRQLLI